MLWVGEYFLIGNCERWYIQSKDINEYEVCLRVSKQFSFLDIWVLFIIYVDIKLKREVQVILGDIWYVMVVELVL